MNTITIPNTKDQINTLPTTTGIYIYYAGKEIIYIGKSVNLKARLLSHLENSKLDAKEAGIVNNANTIECIITDSEFKALLLESQLISKHKPKYNVRWRDDKSYLYIKVSIADDYPKFTLARRPDFVPKTHGSDGQWKIDDKSLYFGPFPSVRSAEGILREVRKVFPFCSQKQIGKRPCFYSKIHLCDPCPSYIESLKLKVKSQSSKVGLTTSPFGDSSFKRRRAEIPETSLNSPPSLPLEATAKWGEGGVDPDAFRPGDGVVSSDEGEILDALRHSSLTRMTQSNNEAIEQSNHEIRELKRKYRYNVKQVIKVLDGQTDLVLMSLYKQLKELSEEMKYEEAMQIRNRIFRLEGLIQGRRMEPESLEDYNRSADSLKSLKNLLLRYFPDLQNANRIECYDISNTSQKQGTASMVVFTDGLIDKKEYRRFKIKDLKLQSDFEMMDEVLRRRFKHHNWNDPSLLVVDGGKPQVRVAQKVLADLNINIPLIGIAKHPDRLVIGVQDLPMVRPANNHPGFMLIRALRDESHRFAKKYHVLLRTRKMMERL